MTDTADLLAACLATWPLPAAMHANQTIELLGLGLNDTPLTKWTPGAVDVDATTLVSFRNENGPPRPFDSDTLGDSRLTFLTAEEEAAFHATPDFWEAFGATYPSANWSGWGMASAPGFSDDGNEALMFVAVATGTYSGKGMVFQLARRESGWAVIDLDTLFES